MRQTRPDAHILSDDEGDQIVRELLDVMQQHLTGKEGISSDTLSTILATFLCNVVTQSYPNKKFALEEIEEKTRNILFPKREQPPIHMH